MAVQRCSVIELTTKRTNSDSSADGIRISSAAGSAETIESDGEGDGEGETEPEDAFGTFCDGEEDLYSEGGGSVACVDEEVCVL